MSVIEDLKHYKSKDCGCPEETFTYAMASVIMHLDHDGSGTAHIDFGEWSFEIDIKCSSMDELRNEVVEQIDKLPACE